MSFLFIAGALLIAFSEIYVQLLMGRMVTGFAVGIVSVAAPLYIAEIAPPHLRGRCVSTFQLFISIGIFLSFFSAFLFSEGQRWQMLFFIGAFLAFFQLCVIFFIPETPIWMLTRGKKALAIQTLNRLRKDKHWEAEIQFMHKKTKDKMRLADFFTPHMPYILFVGFVLSGFQQITGVNAIIYYTPKIFHNAGITSSTASFLATLSVGVINCLATLFSVWVLDKMGRRVLLLAGSLGMTISLGLLGYGFFVQTHAIGALALTCLMIYMACFAFSLGPVTWVLLSEIFPLKIRGSAMACAMALNWIGNFAICRFCPDMIAIWGGGWSFAIFALISLISFLFVYRCIPETKGKSLEEIEILVRAGKF